MLKLIVGVATIAIAGTSTGAGCLGFGTLAVCALATFAAALDDSTWALEVGHAMSLLHGDTRAAH